MPAGLEPDPDAGADRATAAADRGVAPERRRAEPIVEQVLAAALRVRQEQADQRALLVVRDRLDALDPLLEQVELQPGLEVAGLVDHAGEGERGLLARRERQAGAEPRRRALALGALPAAERAGVDVVAELAVDEPGAAHADRKSVV